MTVTTQQVEYEVMTSHHPFEDWEWYALVYEIKAGKATLKNRFYGETRMQALNKAQDWLVRVTTRLEPPKRYRWVHPNLEEIEDDEPYDFEAVETEEMVKALDEGLA